MPVRDDWVSAAELIRRLDRELSVCSAKLTVVLVDDGSVGPCIPEEFRSSFAVVHRIRRVRLRRNVGHQRAIAIGLVYIERNLDCDAVLVMDADGEDTPEGALQLIRALVAQSETGAAIAIFAERSRRTESIVFRTFYRVYKVVHRVLTGVSVRVGNFSILPSWYLGRLVVMSELWNHYAAACFRSGLPLNMIPIPRGYRIAGTSKMNFVSLSMHGMSAISVFADVLGVRLLIGATAGSLLAGFGVIAVIAIRVATFRAIPGWATYTAGIFIVIMIQFMTLAITFTFTMLSSRSNPGFIPLRDYEFFIADTMDLYAYE